MILETEGKPPVTYKPGETYYVPPKRVHFSRNLSTTAPVNVLVFLIADKGQPLGVPVKWGPGSSSARCAGPTNRSGGSPRHSGPACGGTVFNGLRSTPHYPPFRFVIINFPDHIEVNIRKWKRQLGIDLTANAISSPGHQN